MSYENIVKRIKSRINVCKLNKTKTRKKPSKISKNEKLNRRHVATVQHLFQSKSDVDRIVRGSKNHQSIKVKWITPLLRRLSQNLCHSNTFSLSICDDLFSHFFSNWSC